MRGAGVQQAGGNVTVVDLPDPRPLKEGEVLIDVHAAGVGNWDDIVRTGGWDVGVQPPMALGVAAAGVVRAFGSGITHLKLGDEVFGHAAPLAWQGTWAQQTILAEEDLAVKPASVSWEIAGAFPVPGLTAHQVLGEVLKVVPGETLLVFGAGGATGGLIVQLAAIRGIRVVAVAGAGSVRRLAGLGATAVVDYAAADWVEQVRRAAGGVGVQAAANAARGHASSVLQLVADGGRLATITGDPPVQERGITITDVYVHSSGDQLTELSEFLAAGRLDLPIAGTCSLDGAGAALQRAVSAARGGASVVVP